MSQYRYYNFLFPVIYQFRVKPKLKFKTRFILKKYLIIINLILKKNFLIGPVKFL